MIVLVKLKGLLKIIDKLCKIVGLAWNMRKWVFKAKLFDEVILNHGQSFRIVGIVLEFLD